MTAVDPRYVTPEDGHLADPLEALRALIPEDSPDDGNTLTLYVEPSALARLVHRLAVTPGYRLADMFACAGDDLDLYLVWAIDPAHRYVVLHSPVHDTSYPPLSDLAPAAFTEECEIYEQFGVRPASGKPLNRIMLPPHADAGFPRLGHAPEQPPADVHAEHSVGGEAFEFPFGPVRGAGLESLYFGLVTSGEEVVDLYLFTWHKHRGVEWRLRGRTPSAALFLVERMEGLCAVGNGWAFAAAVEHAYQLRVPPAASFSRGIALELERLYNHAAAMAALCQSTGLSVGQAAAEIALEQLLRVNAMVFGHRYLFGVVEIGGTYRAPDLELLRRELPAAYGEFARAADALLSTNSFLDRLEATGNLTREQVRRLGVVGPIARASGVDIDCRRDHAAAPYDGETLRVPTAEPGDCLARLRVMLAEAAESRRLIEEFAAAGPRAGRAELGPGESPCGTDGLGAIESVRGESLAWVSLDDDGRISRARLRPAAARNWRAFDDAVRSQNVFTDVPIIESSFWLTVAGTAR